MTPFRSLVPLALAAALLAPGAPAKAADPAKVFRYAFPVAETSLDPQRISDLYSNILNAGMFDAPLKYDYLARPLKLKPNTLAAMPEIAAQFHSLVNARSGVSDATVYSAFPIDAAQLPGVVASLEKRFGRKLNASVVVDASLIGGIRVVVGDEVLDTSVAARLEQMKVALTA